MKQIHAEPYKVTVPVKLSDIPSSIKTGMDKKQTKKELKNICKKLSSMQDTMYAHDRYSVLVCLQGMDTAGKDSLIREVFRRFNPRGVVVHSFKTPTSKELQHDYLWRHYTALPEKGKYGIFNRSHYENLLVTRVNPELLLKENIPGIEHINSIPEDFWKKRMEQIRNFEKHITENGTIVFKFFLHLSEEEQRQRLLRRLEEEKHNWKFTPSDISERGLWDKYEQYYEEVINHTSFPYAPWYVVPADDKHTARYLTAKIIYDTMSAYTDIKNPELDPRVKENLSAYKAKLAHKKL